MKNTVFIVDDSFYMRTMLKNILSDAGFKIVGEAAEGANVVEKVMETQPDLVTLDMILPDHTGIEVLRRLKLEKPDIKVVMVSAVGQEAIVNEALQEGALAYIVKPFSEEKVINIVTHVLENDY
ncbi:MAG: response regulator [Bacteroidota bacterium]|nr:response regulator [Bacteroidota bacterium]